jgi:hypothetical protein
MNNKTIMNRNQDPILRESNFEHAKSERRNRFFSLENNSNYANLRRNIKRKILYRKLREDLIPLLERKYKVRLIARQIPDDNFETDNKGKEEIKVLWNYRLNKEKKKFVKYPINSIENISFEFDILNTDSSIFFQYFYTINYLKSNNNIFLQEIRLKKLIQLFIENLNELNLNEIYFKERISSLIKFAEKRNNSSNIKNLINELYININENIDPSCDFSNYEEGKSFDPKQDCDLDIENRGCRSISHYERNFGMIQMNSERSENNFYLINNKEILNKKHFKNKASVRLTKHKRKMNKLSKTLRKLKYLLKNYFLNSNKKLDKGIFIHISKDGFLKILEEEEENLTTLRNSTIASISQIKN